MEINKRTLLVCLCTLGIAMQSGYAQQENQQRERRQPPSIDELFEHLDANEDGKLSKKEVRGPLSRDFDNIDLNEDGFLSREELEKAPKPERRERPNRN